MSARIREIAHAVKDLRYRLDMTQLELAGATRLALRTISVYETANTPGSPLGLLRFARIAMENRFMDLVRIFLKDEPDTLAIYEALEKAWNQSERALAHLTHASRLHPASASLYVQTGAGKTVSGIALLWDLIQQAQAEIETILPAA